MTLTAERVRIRPPFTQDEKPRIIELENYKSTVMGFEMQVPQNFKHVIERQGYTRLVQSASLNPTDLRIDIFHDSNYFMSAKDAANLYRSNDDIQTVSNRREIDVDSRKACMLDIRSNPKLLLSENKTLCFLNDESGSVWTIAFTAPSASIHRKQLPLFEKILSSFRFI